MGSTLNDGEQYMAKTSATTQDMVKEYYGQVLQTNRDLKTTACCSVEVMPKHLRPLVDNIEEEVRARFYGCGAPLPPVLEGKTILDLGSGSGRDCYLLSQLVGPQGKVIGVDMTDEQLAVARKHLDTHMKRFGFAKPNIDFRKGNMEDLKALDIADNSVDVVVSNCVFNLSPDKPRLFAEVFRVLKPGGELYFSDVFSDRRVPPALVKDPVLLGECLSGALYVHDFKRMMRDVGCLDVREISRGPVSLGSSEIDRKIGMITFSSITYRAFKLDLEDLCEDYGQVAYYQGTIPEHPHTFALDDHHLFKTGVPMLVCGNTADMISKTRFAPHFKVVGDKSTHHGLFDCGPTPSTGTGAAANGAACC
jgi:SAM-dependent methyltransferase